MLKGLQIRNFRSIRDTGPLDLASLNILVGPNNSGKSSILATLLLLKQTVTDKDQSAALVTSGPIVDLGSYLDFVPGDPRTTSFGISFQLDPKAMPEAPRIRFGEEKEERTAQLYDWFDFTFRYDRKHDRVEIYAFQMRDSKTGNTIAGDRRDGKWKLAGFPQEIIPHLEVVPIHFIPSFRPTGRKPENEQVTRRVEEESFLSFFRAQHVGGLFENLLYVGPVRERIPRYGMLGTMAFSELGPSGQNLMKVLASTRVRGRSGKTLISALDDWLGRRFGVLKNVRLKNLDKARTVRALLADDPGGAKNINLASTGSGISQLVPVVVQTMLTPPGGCLVVEQPEVHLHPAAQASLADLFVDQLRAKKSRQYIIETHSEHFLLRIRRRVAEGKIQAEAVRVFCVEKVGGATEVRALSLEPSGHFKEWPAGFFEEGYLEALALARASMGKKSNGEGLNR